MIVEFSTSERLKASILISLGVTFDYVWKPYKNRVTGQMIDIIEFRFQDNTGYLNQALEGFEKDEMYIVVSKVVEAQRLIAKLIKNNKKSHDNN